jgi:hypothetical protein
MPNHLQLVFLASTLLSFLSLLALTHLVILPFVLGEESSMSSTVPNAFPIATGAVALATSVLAYLYWGPKGTREPPHTLREFVFM